MLPLKRFAALFASALFLLLPTTAAAAECEFVLGFKTLRDLIGHDVVGECLENQHHGANGDGLQHTTGGLLVWRKADNWTAFTDGYRSWVNGPNGLEQRLNIEFLPWEAENAIAVLPWVSDGLQDYWEGETAQSLRKLQQASPQVFWELMQKPWIQSESLSVNGAFLPMLYRQVLALTYRDEAMALRVMRMPFMVGLGYGTETAWQVLNELLISDAAGLQDLLAHPELRNGITSDKFALLPVLYLETRDPESAAAIRKLPRFSERPSNVNDLQHLALASQPVFWAWMEHFGNDPYPGPSLSDIIYLALHDEAAVLQMLRMPFLQTKEDGDDYMVVSGLSNLERTRPGSIRQILSHPRLLAGITDDHLPFIHLLILRINNPRAAAIIEALPWVQDGLGRPINRTLHIATAHPSEFEERTIKSLARLAEKSYELLESLVGKPWMQDGLTYWELKAVENFVDISGWDQSIANQFLSMPFLDTLEMEDAEVLDTLRTLFEDKAGLRYVVSHPKLAGGIRDGQRAIVALVRLEWEKPDTAQLIWSLPWVADGITDSDTHSVLVLYRLARESTEAFQVVAAKPWIQDGLTAYEVSVIRDIAANFRR
ncbi:MAG: hypothetical protein OXM03_02515 [Chloroflexota bacterium]|nr:hypothetical protein [Chloroflexota bacterium]